MWRRPWVVFGVSVFVVAVATICLFGNALIRVQRQHAILMKINALGGGYEYVPADDWGIPFAWQIPRQAQVTIHATDADLTAILELASELIDLQSLELKNAARLSEIQIAAIASMRELRGLTVKHGAFSDQDLARLVGLKKLEALHLRDTQVTDQSLATLNEFPALTMLDLRETPVTYASIVTWHAAHPKCAVAWRPMLLPEQLEALNRLRQLDIPVAPLDNPTAIEPSWYWIVTLHDTPRVWPLLRQLQHVREIRIDGEQYIDWDLQQLAKLQSLEHVTINNLSTTPQGVDALAGLSRLQSIFARGMDVGESDLLRLREACSSQPKIQYGDRRGVQHPPPPLDLNRLLRFDVELPLEQLQQLQEL